VPGVPVYLFSGIVLGKQGETIESVGFTGGCLIAIALCCFLKMLAAVSQYLIGYWMGKSVKIQQLIGVDKVFTRAIEFILRRPGLAPGKVAVLVGGPDWPTSVTCGILGMNVGQMLLGTSPVCFVISPTVLAGAFLAKVKPGEDNMYGMLANIFVGATFVVQGGSLLLAVKKIMDVVNEHGEELSKPRPEHEVVAALTKHEEAANKAYQEVIDWKVLPGMQKVMITVAALLIFFCDLGFFMFGELCWENFNISGRIDDALDNNGLGGNPVNIMLFPGKAALAVFFFGVALHIIFVWILQRATRAQLEMNKTTAAMVGSGVQPVVVGSSSTDTKPLTWV